MRSQIARASSQRPSKHSRIISTWRSTASVPNPISAPSAPIRNDSKMKLSLPVSRSIGRSRRSIIRRVWRYSRASNEASLRATTLSMAAIRRSVSSANTTPPSAGWSWNATSGRPQPRAIASWYATGTAGSSGVPW